jgi:signal peptidase II
MSRTTVQDNARIAGLAAAVILVDQLTKLIVLKFLGFSETHDVVPGFFRLVHWGNTGAAWSMLTGNNGLLAVIAMVAVVVLIFARHHFDPHTLGGQVALGLIFGGIIGNLIDRVLPSRRHVIDFLYFYVIRRDGTEAGFPAFNVADSAICIGVGLLFVLSWQSTGSVDARPSGGAPR